MKTVNVITIYDLGNYGNRLQNYALTITLQKMNYKVYNLVKRNKEHKKTDLRILFLPVLKGDRKKKALRDKLFYNFAHLKLKKYYTNGFVICGSDQIWHPNWHGTPFMFLAFAPKNKRIAYSASFGVSTLPEDKKKEYAQFLSEMKAISVREESGAKIVKDLIGKDVPVLIDPTLMLEKADWQKISKKPDFPVPEKYLLTYYLGEVSQERNQYMKKVASEKGLGIIRLENHNTGEAWWKTGPSEFLWLIEHCSLMCTDSFHGSVFSILMEVPFLVFNREDSMGDMSSRIDTLLSKFKLENRKFNNQQGADVFEKDYRHVQEILMIERKKALDYLKEALER